MHGSEGGAAETNRPSLPLSRFRAKSNDPHSSALPYETTLIDAFGCGRKGKLPTWPLAVADHRLSP